MNAPIIAFTGGGTAGHVTPNLALISVFQAEGWVIHYIGSDDGIEKSMIEPLDVSFHGVRSGKLRRYFSLKNALDPFKVLVGIIQSVLLLRRIKPQVVFSKGGFVAFPVVLGAWLNRIPIVAHESDITPGLANKLSFPFVTKICLTFDAAQQHFKQRDKTLVTGTPLRASLFSGVRERGVTSCGFTDEKPCLLVIGGSLGAGSINQAVRQALASLTQRYQIIHLCGKGKLDTTLRQQQGYYQLEYANEELPDLFAAADLVISRSGANSLYEILALGKPHVLIPLSAKVSRGDQIHNARYTQQLGVSVVIEDDLLTVERLLAAVEDVMTRQEEIKQGIAALQIHSATDRVVAVIKEQIDA